MSRSYQATVSRFRLVHQAHLGFNASRKQFSMDSYIH